MQHHARFSLPLLLVVALKGPPALAAPVDELGRASQVTREVVIDGSSDLTYATDYFGTGGQAKLDKAVLGATKNSVSIVVKYLNPLENTWKLSTTAAPDPNAIALKKFAESLEGLTGLLSGGGATAKVSASLEDLKRNTGGRQSLKDEARGEDAPEKVTLYSSSLREWLMWRSQEAFASCIDQAQFLKDIAEVDGRLYGAEVTATKSHEFKDALVAAVTALKEAEQFATFVAAVADAKTKSKSLATLDRQVTEALQKLVESNAAAVAKAGASASDSCKRFSEYTDTTIKRFISEARQELQRHETAIAALDELLNGFETLLSVNKVTDEKQQTRAAFQVVPNLPVPSDTDVTVTLIVQRRKLKADVLRRDLKIEFSDAGESKATFIVRPYEGVGFEVAAGLAYSFIEYETFGTTQSGGKTVIAPPKTEHQGLAAVAFLNMVPAGADRLLLQVGVGTAKKYPLLCLGAGLRWAGGRFSLGLGWTWTQRLGSLQVGSEVKGTADIDADLEYQWRWRPRPYLSFQKDL
jgi:hypothetical protein